MKLITYFAALLLFVLVLNDQYQSSTALRKRKIFKKLKEFLPLLLALKGKKKLLVLPIPIPIRLGKENKETWPALPAWPAPQSNQNNAWSSGIPETISYESFLQSAQNGNSWSSPSIQSSPPAKIAHSFMPSEYSNIKQSSDAAHFLTTYVVKDGAGLSSYSHNAPSVGKNNNNFVSSNYGSGTPMSYGRSQDLEARKPIVVSNKPIATKKQPTALFGQPAAVDDYENGKGSAAIYNEASNAPRPDNNKVQFQNDFSSASSSSTYNDNNDYKESNEANYDNKIRSVSGDYSGNQLNADASNNYEESNNELINENKDQTFVPNPPSVRIPLRKKVKV